MSRTRLDNRCYAPIFTRRIFLRVSIETCNILLILPSPDFKIFPNSFKGLARCYCVGETSSSLFFPLSFFFFFYDTLSLEFPYITRVVYIIVSTQCCYYRVEIRFNTLQGRCLFPRIIFFILFRFPIIVFFFFIQDRWTINTTRKFHSRKYRYYTSRIHFERYINETRSREIFNDRSRSSSTCSRTTGIK